MPTPMQRRRTSEFNSGRTYERYAGEHTRGRVTAEGAAAGTVAAGSAAAATSLSGAKLAGTPLGQSVLHGAEHRLRVQHKVTGQEPARHAADQVARYKKYGQWAGKNRLKATGGVLGATALAGGARIAQRVRSNEEAGISQGIGRMKAGEHYERTSRRVSKSVIHTAALASDLQAAGPRTRKAAEWTLNNRAKLTKYGLVGTGVVATGTGIRIGQNHAREARQLRRELRPTGKVVAAKKLKLKEHFGTPGRAVRTIGRNPQHIAAGAVLAGGAALQHPSVKKPRTSTTNQRREKNAGTAAAVGGTAGHLTWMGHTQRLRAESHKLEHVVPEGMSRNKRDKIMSAHRKEYGIPHGGVPNRHQAVGYFRNYPEEMPAAPLKRKLGRIATGSAGLRNQGKAIAAGAVPLAIVGAASTRGRKQKVGKALYAREERLSPLRVAQFGAGAGLAAWGLGRSRFLGAALARGVKAASGKNNAQAVEALQLAMSAQGALRRGTAPAERSLRQIRRVNTAINAVPAPFRPEIASAAGLLLAGHAGPLHTTRYRQVSSPVGYGR